MTRLRLDDPIFFTPPPTKLDKRMWKKDQEAPAPDPRMYDIMAQQVGLSKEALDFVKTAYGENIERLKALDESQLKINDALLTDAATARERSGENYQFYMDKYRPVEEQVIRDAQTIDSESNIAGARGRALADVQQQAGIAQQASNRSMSRYGLQPNATRMAAINSQLAAQTAAAGAGAMQNAEQGQRDRGTAMRTNVANIGRGYPAQSMAWTQSAQGAGQTSLGNQAMVNNAYGQNNAFMQGGYGQSGNMLNQAASQWNQMYGTQMSGWNAAQQSNSSSMAGLGSLVGMGMKMYGFADGGKITGPGTGTSDSIPGVNVSTGQAIRVSNGEYIVPKSVVDAKGTEFFDKLVERYHTPVRQAALKR